jgi:two-component system sensor histidine kinase DesK
MQIKDNGRGGLARDGNGMTGMRERVRAMGGTLGVESPLAGGTQLRVLVPVPVLRLVESSRVASAVNPVQASSSYPAT